MLSFQFESLGTAAYWYHNYLRKHMVDLPILVCFDPVSNMVVQKTWLCVTKHS